MKMGRRSTVVNLIVSFLLLFFLVSEDSFAKRGGNKSSYRIKSYSSKSYSPKPLKIKSYSPKNYSKKAPSYKSFKAYKTSYSASSKPKRSRVVRSAFHRSNPCPSTGRNRGACPGYEVDHIVPLACGGADSVSNMQWLTKSANRSKGAMGCRRR